MLNEVAKAAAAVAEEENIAQAAALAAANSAPTPVVRQNGKRRNAAAPDDASSASSASSATTIVDDSKSLGTRVATTRSQSAKLVIESPAPTVRRSKRLRAGSDLESPLTQQLPLTQYDDFSQAQVGYMCACICCEWLYMYMCLCIYVNLFDEEEICHKPTAGSRSLNAPAPSPSFSYPFHFIPRFISIGRKKTSSHLRNG